MSEQQQLVVKETDALFESYRNAIYRRTDRFFAVLMISQWIGCVAIARLVSPRAWIGIHSQIHIHVLAAIFLGGIITVLPVMLAWKQPGMALTRYVIATAQMLMGGLLIHVTGGRIETHFHIFGSLAFLACYRDWRVLVPATIVVVLDHWFRGLFFPQSIYGVMTSNHYRFLEHAWWVIFEDAFLFVSCLSSTREMRSIALRSAELSSAKTAAEKAMDEARLAKGIAEAAVAAKSEFLANMSHEIRTPMNGVLGMLELLIASPLQSRQLRHAQIARSSGTALMSLLNNILDYSKIEAGKLELFVEPLDLQALIEEIIDMFAGRAHEKGLAIVARVDPTLFSPVLGDVGRLRQVLMNLISNAIKFTERGQIIVRASSEADDEQQITARITVNDSGIGITDQQMERLFKSFSQGDASTTRQYGGTGLGLAISAQLVQMMGGEMGVDSAANVGSRFWFTLPLQRQTVVSERPVIIDSGVRQLRAARLKADLGRSLLVDGNAMHGQVILQNLRAIGLDVDFAAAGDEAVAMVRAEIENKNPYGTIITDARLMDMLGSTLATELQPDYAASTIRPILIAMATNDQQRELDALGAGPENANPFHAYLYKPVRQSTLYDVLLEASARRSLPRRRMDDIVEPLSIQTAAIGSRRVLVAEDNKVNQIVITDMLTAWGYAVEIASDGQAAVEAVQGRRFDLVLMDWQMPIIDGLQAARMIRQMESAGQLTCQAGRLPIFGLTANAFPEDAAQCRAAGMDAHFAKPINATALFRRIESVFAVGSSSVAA